MFGLDPIEQARPNQAAADITALARWWQLAGVDVLVDDVPHPWADATIPLSDPLPEVESTLSDATPSELSARQQASASQTVPQAEPATDWDKIATLAELRTRVLAEYPSAPFADGNAQSGLMIMGDYPSAADLETGRPFSGPAGRFLDRMLAAIGLDRSGCYISLLTVRRNVPGRPPPEAMAADLALARAHVRLVAPRLLLLLGASPVRELGGMREPIGRIRGTWLDVRLGDQVIPALASYNPAYLLRRPAEKAAAWADLLAFKRRFIQ